MTSTNALNHVSTYTYDELGRQTAATTPTGTSTTVYDALGRVSARTDAAGRTTRLTYDGLNRITQVRDAGGFVSTFAYDEVSNKVSQTDANGHETRFAYDNLGRMVGRMLPMGQTESRTYRPDGRMSSRTDFNGHTTQYVYEESTGRMLSQTGWNGERITFAYTPDGLLASKTRSGGADGQNLTTRYTYDLWSRPIGVATPTGTMGYEYDVAGNITGVALPSATLHYEYDALNRMQAVVHPDGSRTTYGYNAVGNRATRTLPGGVTTTFGYDAANRLIDVNNPIGASFHYTLDGSGKRLTATSSTLGTTTYGYDSLGRLVSEQGAGSAAGYGYDRVGNRTSKTINGMTVGYTYNANDQMLSEGAKTFDYDANGNTISADGMSLSYDFEDHLIGTGGGQAGATTYTYDADGNRIRRMANEQVTTYLVEDVMSPYAQVVEERAGLTGNLQARYEMGVGLARMVRPGNGPGSGAYGYLHDGQGSVVGLVNGQGQLTDTYAYDAWGNPQRLSGTTANPFLFNGEQYDGDEGLYYLRARYYAPQQGRFLTHDPLMGSVGDPLSLHRYLYANADPVNNSDPTGMFSLGEQTLTVNLAPSVRMALNVAYKGIEGGLLGAVASGGRAALLGESYDDILQETRTGAAFGAAFGVTGGLLQGCHKFRDQCLGAHGLGCRHHYTCR